MNEYREGYGADFEAEGGIEESEEVAAALTAFRGDWMTPENEHQIEAISNKIKKIKKDDLILKEIGRLDTELRTTINAGEYKGEEMEEDELVSKVLAAFKPKSMDQSEFDDDDEDDEDDEAEEMREAA